MAQRTQIILIDDLDGKEVASGGQTVTFGYDGVEYSIDLSDKNAAKLASALAPFIAAARKSGGRGKAAPKKPAPPAKVDTHQLRAWAREHGYQVSDRGRVSREIQQAYALAR
jgi:hypothetical protein